MSFLATIRSLENVILDFMIVGLDKSELYLAPPQKMPGHGPTYGYPFSTLEKALIPLTCYAGLLVFGWLFMREGRVMLNKHILYALKFVYNFLQIFLSGHIAVEGVKLMYRHNIYIFFTSHDQCTVYDPTNPLVMNYVWLFYMTKILDFMDTFFIIVSGKTSQFTFLHIYHHFYLLIIFWINTNVAVGNEMFACIMVNAFVHTLMYSYYLISMHTENIWWKKYLTVIQITQFVLLMINGALEYRVDCAMPRRVRQMYLFTMFIFIVLFSKLYFATYSRKKIPPIRKSWTSAKTNNFPLFLSELVYFRYFLMFT